MTTVAQDDVITKRERTLDLVADEVLRHGKVLFEHSELLGQLMGGVANLERVLRLVREDISGLKKNGNGHAAPREDEQYISSHDLQDALRRDSDAKRLKKVRAFEGALADGALKFVKVVAFGCLMALAGVLWRELSGMHH